MSSPHPASALTTMERNVFTQYVRADRDLELTARVLNLTVTEADAHIASVRTKTLFRVYGPPSEGWHVQREIARITGLPGRWLYRAIRAYDRLAVWWVARGNGHLLLHYPSAVARELEELYASRFQEPNADWYYLEQLHRELGVSHDWLHKRLAPAKPLAKPRRNAAGRSSPCYPPPVVRLMRQLRDQHFALPPGGDYYTITELAAHTGRSRTWVIARLGALGAKPEPRRDYHNRVRDHYPKKVLEVLQELARPYPPMDLGLEVTLTTICTELGQRPEKVKPVLQQLGLRSQRRIHPTSGHEVDCFRRSVIKRLRPFFVIHPPPGDYHHRMEIGHILDRSSTWVYSRIKRCGFSGEERITPDGRVLLHFSPEQIQQLALLSEQEGRPTQTQSPA